MNLTAGDPLAGLSRWVADGVVDAAARQRARQRWLERQAGEEATVLGVLVDLAERGRPVALTTVGGHRCRGRVVAVAADFAVVREDRLGDVFLPLSSVALVRAAPGEDTPTGDRPLALEIVLADALVELSAERPTVLVSVLDEEVRGELRSAGFDVAAIALDGPRREIVHVSVGAIDHIVVLKR